MKNTPNTSTLQKMTFNGAMEALLLALFYLPLTPLFLLISPWLTIVRVPSPLRGNGEFNRLVLSSEKAMLSRFLAKGMLRNALAPLHLFTGEMRLVGVCADVNNHPKRGFLTYPLGLFSLHGLKQQTNIDFETSEQSNQQYLQNRSFRGDVSLLIRNLLAGVYGQTNRSEGSGIIAIDTLLLHNHTMESALHVIEQRLAQNEAMCASRVSFVNPACVNIARTDVKYRKAVNSSSIILADGIGIRIAGQILGTPVLQNVNGTDLFPRLCELSVNHGHKIFFLGARPGVVEEVIANSQNQFPGIQIAGGHHGYINDEESLELVEKINQSGADMLLVAMGVPNQELWIQRYESQLNVKVIFGVGGLFDFIANRIPRAPEAVRQLGLEWAFRLVQEPKRMWRRYLLGNVSFLMHVLVQRYCGWVIPQVVEQYPVKTRMNSVARQAVLVTGFRMDEDTGSKKFHIANLPLADRTVLEFQIEALAEAGCTTLKLAGLKSDEVYLNQVIESRDWGCALSLDLFESIEAAKLIGQLWHTNAELPSWYLEDHTLPNQKWLQKKRNQSRLDLSSPSNEQLNLDHPRKLIEANKSFRELGIRPGPMFRQHAPGVWVHLTARVSPKAMLSGPAFIGKNCIIMDHALVGPGSNLVTQVVVDSYSEVVDSVVLESVHVASGLRLSCTMMNHESLVKFDLGACLDLTALRGHLEPLRSKRARLAQARAA